MCCPAAPPVGGVGGGVEVGGDRRAGRRPAPSPSSSRATATGLVAVKVAGGGGVDRGGGVVAGGGRVGGGVEVGGDGGGGVEVGGDGGGGLLGGAHSSLSSISIVDERPRKASSTKDGRLNKSENLTSASESRRSGGGGGASDGTTAPASGASARGVAGVTGERAPSAAAARAAPAPSAMTAPVAGVTGASLPSSTGGGRSEGRVLARSGSSGLFWSLKSCSLPKTSCNRRPVFSHKLSSGARLRWARWIVSAAVRTAAYRCRAVAIRAHRWRIRGRGAARARSVRQPESARADGVLDDARRLESAAVAAHRQPHPQVLLRSHHPLE